MSAAAVMNPIPAQRVVQSDTMQSAHAIVDQDMSAEKTLTVSTRDAHEIVEQLFAERERANAAEARLAQVRARVQATEQRALRAEARARLPRRFPVSPPAEVAVQVTLVRFAVILALLIRPTAMSTAHAIVLSFSPGRVCRGGSRSSPHSTACLPTRTSCSRCARARRRPSRTRTPRRSHSPCSAARAHTRRRPRLVRPPPQHAHLPPATSVRDACPGPHPVNGTPRESARRALSRRCPRPPRRPSSRRR